MAQMLDNKWLGNKSGPGLLQEDVMVDGEREFWTLNPETLDYEPRPKVRFDSVGAVRKIEDLGPRVSQLLEHDDRAANYVRDIALFRLCLRRLRRAGNCLQSERRG